MMDIDRDGNLEIAVGDDSGVFYVWQIPGSNSSVRWPCIHYDPCHTGLVPIAKLPELPPPTEELVGKFFVYPNPAANSTNIRYYLGAGVIRATLIVLDMSGQPVTKETEITPLPFADNETTLNLETVPPGLYIVRLKVEGPERKETRFTKLAVVR